MKRIRTAGHWSGWFYDEVYRANVDLIWPVNAEQVAAFMKRRYAVDYAPRDEFGAKCVEVRANDHAANVICLKAWPRKPDATDYSFLAHEAFHAAEHILSNRGVVLVSGATTEPYAYLIESIVRRCLRLLDVRRPLQ